MSVRCRPFGSMALLVMAWGVVACLGGWPGAGLEPTVARFDPEVGLIVHCSRPGRFRMDIPPETDPNRWTQWVLHNRSDRTIRRLMLWSGGEGLLRTPTGDAHPLWRPFALWPGERLVLTECDGAASSGQHLLGELLWDMSDGMDEGLWRAAGARFEHERGWVWNLHRGALIEMAFNAPFPHESARLAWRIEPPDVVVPQVWAGPTPRKWSSVARTGRRTDTWLNPMDLSTNIRGSHQAFVRLVFPPVRGADPTAEAALTRLRLERRVAAPGRLRRMEPGRSVVRLDYAALRSSSLELTLRAP